MPPKTKLIIPKTLDEEIKRRLKTEEIVSFLDTLDLRNVQDAEGIKYLVDYPERLANGWTMTEVNYLLYGQEIDGDLFVRRSHFDYYNFFNYIDTRDPERMVREDICEADKDLAPHVHALAYTPERNVNREANFLGTLHNHPLLGFPSRKRMNTVDAVGFSTEDEWWNNHYLEKYGVDGRKLAFAVYYSDNDFYMGVTRTKSIHPKLLDICVED